MNKPAEIKQQAITQILKQKRSVSLVARELGVARKTIYSWIRRYQKASPRKKVSVLESAYRKGRYHPQAKAYTAKSCLVRLIVKHPSWGTRYFCQALRKKGFKLSLFTVYYLLKQLQAATPEDRQSFIVNWAGPGRLTPENKSQLVAKLVKEGLSISSVAREAGIARKTLYQWLDQYKKEVNSPDLFKEKYVSGETHPKAVYPKIRDQILDLVIAHPQWSVHSLAKEVNVSSWTIWSLLKRHNLQTAADRMMYSTKFAPVPAAKPTQIIDTVSLPSLDQLSPNVLPGPPPPLGAEAQAKDPLQSPLPDQFPPPQPPPFAPSPRTRLILISSLTLLFVVVGILLPVLIITTLLQSRSIIQVVGYLSAFGAIGFGSFFFVYSMKYYLTIALVLLFSRRTQTDNVDAKTKNEFDRSQTSTQAFEMLAKQGVGRTGLIADVTQVQLDRQPFVSIHIPLYNEKRVVNRLLEAVTSMAYDNYEVIVCDDSTDETKDIVLEWQNHPRVKISHRENRQGYKGGALKQALSLMDPKTEFVLVFDADFLPYPDTITQFLKYFQLLSPLGHLSDLSNLGNTAAIQGYQWHVLNKSENWITRGVRSEYAGSYVIERSGSEIYHGLKQIAGSVFAIRADLLKAYGWKTSITEDFELTLKLYRDGYKVVYTPYIQAPSECVSTLKRLVRQRMRWAEGHSHNIRKHFMEMLFGRWEKSRSPLSHLGNLGNLKKEVTSTFLPSRLTTTEKLEFLYLAPYYLQSAFFIVGTALWFMSEVVFRVRLPFWTQVWGWSLVLTNMLSLPLMNTVGMFLEESEEKDYAGIPAFLLLSYILAPFQAYAAVKGFLEKEEGPWFRTPKTGRITDVYKRGHFYRWLSSWLPGFSGTGQLNKPIFVLNYVFAKSVTSQKQPARRRGRLRLRSKAVLSLFILLAMVLNYLSFFTPPPARAVSPAFEQQINIMNKNSSTTSTTDTPTDNSLGLVHWDGTKYTGATVYFEAILQTNNAGSTATATLYDSAGSSVSGSSVSVLGTAWTRVRSAAITLTNNTDYTVRFKTSANTASFRTARLIILQSDATRITDTVTQVELGINSTTTSTSYIFAAAKKKLFGYNSTVWTPTPTIYFEATLANNTAGQTALAALYEKASTCATVVSGSEVTVTGTTWALVRSSAITLTSGTDYMMCVKAGANTAQIANAKIILEQTDAAGITNIELYHMYVSIDVQTTSTTFVQGNFMNEFNPSNFTGGTFTYFSEATLRVTTSGPTATADLYNTTDAVAITGSTVTETVTAMTRDRSADITANMPASAKDLEGELKTDSGTAQVADSHLVIQVSSLTVPEKTLIFFPLALFLPFLIKRRKSLRASLKSCFSRHAEFISAS